MEKRYCALNALRLNRNDIEREDDDKFIHIKGYGCHFNVVNKNGEMVNEESFKDFFDELDAGGLMPVLNYQHMPDKIIGCWDKITSDEKGLWCEGRIFKDVKFVQDTIVPLMDGGALNSLSTEGFVPWEDEEIVHTDSDPEKDEPYFFSHKFILLGISLVALPADFDARVSSENKLTLERRNNKETKADEEKPKAKKSKVIITI